MKNRRKKLVVLSIYSRLLLAEINYNAAKEAHNYVIILRVTNCVCLWRLLEDFFGLGNMEIDFEV